MDSSEADAKLIPGKLLVILLAELSLRVHDPLQHVVGLLVIGILGCFASGSHNRSQELVCSIDALVDLLHLWQPWCDKSAFPGPEIRDLANGLHQVNGIVDRGVKVFLLATKLWANEDASRCHCDNTKELVHDLDLCPFSRMWELDAQGFDNFVGDDRVQSY